MSESDSPDMEVAAAGEALAGADADLAPAPAAPASEADASAADPAEAATAPADDEPEQIVRLGKREVKKSSLFKFIGFIAFIVVMIAAVAAAWPYIQGLYQEGGIQGVLEGVQNAGAVGVILLFCLQFLQIVVAIIPGEVVQFAAGALYGTWLGALIIIVGCVFSSAAVFQIVHKLGAPFVQEMVSTRFLGKFREFEQSGKLDVTVFVLFLIPGMPKDVFTYLVPLTDMPMGKFLLLANVARVPGILLSTYAANGLLEGRIIQSIVLFAIVLVIAIVAFLKREAIIQFLDRHLPSRKKKQAEAQAEARAEEGAEESAEN